MLVRRFLRAVTRAVYKEEWNPVDGSFQYMNTNTKIFQKEKPTLLGSEIWRPNNIIEWDLPRVIIFIRRIGLKQYVDKFEKFDVHGRALVMLDDEDFDNMEIWNKIHRKKILVEIERIFTFSNRVGMIHEHELRREGIRKSKLFNASAVSVQRCYRGYLARNNVWNMREVIRVNIESSKMTKATVETASWYAAAAIT